MKKLLFAIAALFCTTLSFAQEYMIIENTAGGWTSIDVSVISQAYFKTYPASGQGTKENPFNVAAANEKCKEIGSEPSTEKYYVKGIVVNNSNGVYAYIADDESGANRLYVYKLTVPEGITLNKNDEVIIYGVLYHYRNLTTEMEGELVSINGQIISGNDIQTVPISDVIAGEDGVTYSVRGEVTQIANPTWGNFYMKDETGELYIYGTLDATGAPKNFESLGIEVGDIVTVMGPKKTYVGTPELVNVKVIKIEKPVITAKGSGTLSDPYNVQGALDYINTLGADTPSEQDVYIKGYVTNIGGQFGTQYGNATFTISDTKSGGNSLTIYRGLYLGNVKYSEGPLLNEGDEVIICGKVVNYKGTTPETVANQSYIYSLNGKTEIENGGGTQSDEVKAVTIAQFKAAEVSSDVWYQLTGIVVNLKENDVYGNFDLVDATDSVYVYGLLSEKGGEKKKFQDLVAAKGITNGSKITIIGTRGVYNGKIEVLNAYFVSIEGEGGGEAATSLTNGDFETWTDSIPTGWKSASTASSGTLEQRTDAHDGSYSCCVKGNESSNKRLASQEITLAAGTYVFSFWVKATTDDVAQARPGYVPVNDGTAGSYSYGDYANLTTSWQQVSYEFTLAAETTVCLVVMNPKKSNYSSGKDILVDDATLTKK